MERIDKLIAVSKNISRADSRALIKRGRVTVDGEIVRDISAKFDEKKNEIACDGEPVFYQKFVYIMMNKPKGVISASEGGNEKTVIDILPDEMKRRKLFPAGRLDKDTTGFMLITDDGDFAHRILSPKNHIPKTYIATLDKPFDSNVVQGFENGVQLKDDLCMPAKIEHVDDDYTVARVTIKQGMYHQIKRMFLHFGITVLELERVKMGDLELDNSLGLGECRYLSMTEIKQIEMSK